LSGCLVDRILQLLFVPFKVAVPDVGFDRGIQHRPAIKDVPFKPRPDGGEEGVIDDLCRARARLAPSKEIGAPVGGVKGGLESHFRAFSFLFCSVGILRLIRGFGQQPSRWHPVIDPATAARLQH
jgi:hypothetical protein